MCLFLFSLSSLILSDAGGPRTDLRGGDAVVFMNDLEKDRQYRQWGRSVQVCAASFRQHIVIASWLD